MGKNSIDIPKKLTDIFGEEADKIARDILNKRSEKLKLIQDIDDLRLPVDDWEKMEDEIIEGATR